jgi:hypothetical protein
MRRQTQQQQLLKSLQSLAALSQPKDMELLKEVEKCPESKAACAALAAALAASDSSKDHANILGPEASWIHSLV